MSVRNTDERAEFLTQLECRGPFLHRDPHVHYERNDGKGDGRFEATYSGVWKRIPTKIRDLLLKFWTDTAVDYVRICAAAYWHGFSTIDGEWTAGATYGGILFYFWTPAIDLMPDEILANLIVHELTHATFRAKGYTYLSEDDEEREVAKAMDLMGFSDSAVCEWMRENNELLANHAQIARENERRDRENVPSFVRSPPS